MNIRPKNHWIWIAYLVCYTFYMTQLTQEFFTPGSSLRNYYIILTMFDVYYLIPFFLNALMILVNICSIVPVYCYIFKRKLFSEEFWKMFFVLRIASELTGHHYEAKVVQAFWFDSRWISVTIVAMGLCWMIPSYMVLYFYAFKHSKIVSGPRDPLQRQTSTIK